MADIVSAPFVRPLTLGDTGPDVLAVKRALQKAGFGEGMAMTYRLGSAAAADVKAFQKQEKLEVDGVYGPATHAKLAPYFDAYGISLLEDEAKALAVAAEPRSRFLAVADLTVVHSTLLGYTEVIGEAPGDRDWYRLAPLDETGANWAEVVQEHGKLTCDCSAHYIGCGEHAGIPSTVAHGVLDSDAATALLLEDSKTITAGEAQPGDGVIFTGPAYPGGAHITILREKLPTGDWKVINHGGPDGTGPSYSTLSAQADWQAEHGAPTLNYRQLPA